VQRWLPLVLASLNMVGQPGSLAQTVLRRMQQESGGNPRAINLTDSNAQARHPSKGLMQVIDPTFRAYAMPGHNSDIWDPLSNILASERYAMARYGSLSAAYNKAGGYGWPTPGRCCSTSRRRSATRWTPATSRSGDVDYAPVVDKLTEQWTDVTMPFVVVDRPAGGSQSERTYADLLVFPSYTALKTAYPTYAATLAGP
jgi:hypothetical protein